MPALSFLLIAFLFASVGCRGPTEAKDIEPDVRLSGMRAKPGVLNLGAVPRGVRVLGISEEKVGPLGGIAGLSLAFGDFNGDGKEDLAVGAPRLPGLTPRRGGSREPGGVYIIYGGSELSTLSELSSAADILLVANTLSAGYSVAFGDVNGDGLDDLIVGAPWGQGFVPYRKDKEGAVAIVFGRRLLSGTHKISELADVLISGAHTGDFAGAALATGDFNGDGIADLLIGAPLDLALGTFERASSGAAYLVLGRSQWPKTIDLAREASMTCFGVRRGDRTGESVALADVTGDGLADILIGAPLADWIVDVEFQRKDSGAVYLVRGRREFPKTLDLASEADSTIYGTERGDGAGWSVVGGDFNGDGTGDVAIGAPLARHKNVRRKEDIYDLIGGNTRVDLGLRAFRSRVSGHAEGEVYLLWGRSKWPSEMDLAKEANVTLYGAPFKEEVKVFFLVQGGGDAGYSLSMGDFNGDGREDLLVGAPFGDGQEPEVRDAGLVHLVLGTDRLGGVAALMEVSAHRVVGSNERYRLGAALALGDFDGDGRDELVASEVRASALDTEETVRGRLYIVKDFPASLPARIHEK
jgi:hypothetical protein